MIVYKYDEEGYFTGEHECQTDPVNGGFLYPANYSLVKPSEGDFKIAKINGEKWELVEDNRHRQIWNILTGGSIYCETKEMPAGHTYIPKPSDFYKWEKGKWVIDEARKTEQENNIIKAKLASIDINSIRSMREYIAGKTDAPKEIKDYEAAAIAERSKLQ